MADPIRADRVKPEKIHWLWRDRIPQGMFSVIAGQPDQGKGLLAAHIAADVSRRGGKVLYSAFEDSHRQMTRPRLEAAGANLRNINLWRFQLPRHFPELRAIITAEKPALIVMDPLASHLSGGHRRSSDNIREVFDPLREEIEKTGTAVLIIEHVNKRKPTSGNPLMAIGGSGSGLVALSRSAYLFGVDPADEDKRVLACVKLNVAERPLALEFEMDTEHFPIVGDVPSLVAGKELSAFDPMVFFQRESKHGPGRPPDKRAAAAEWLANYLGAAGNPVAARKVFEDAKTHGMSSKTLRRAAHELEIVRNPAGGGPNCTWELGDELKERMGLLDPPASTQVTDSADWDKALQDLTKEADDE